jgi:PAS domain S-box-containing protein
VINPDQTAALINKKGREVLGYEEKEMIGKNWFDTFLPEWDRERVKENFIKLISGEMETIEHFESLVLTKGGEERIVAWHNTVLRNEKNQIVGTLSSGEDITKNKEINNLLTLPLFPSWRTLSKMVLTVAHYLNPAAQQLFSKARRKDVPSYWLADLGSIIRNVQSQNVLLSGKYR